MEQFLMIIEELPILVVGFIGLLGTGVSLFFAIKNWAKALKNKNSQEAWKLLINFANKAMLEAEQESKSGADKKDIVLKALEAEALANGIDIRTFSTQLSDYIDQTIAFVNKMKATK